MLTANLMAVMDDDHLIAALRAEQDPLTSSDAEIELLNRFEALHDKQSDLEASHALLDEYQVSTDDMKAVIESHPASLKDQAALLSLLKDHDIHKPDQLKELIELAEKFRALANDAGDFFTRLNDLVSTNQE